MGGRGLMSNREFYILGRDPDDMRNGGTHYSYTQLVKGVLGPTLMINITVSFWIPDHNPPYRNGTSK